MQDVEPLRQTPQSELRTLRQRHPRHLLRIVAQLLNPDAVRAQESDIELHIVPDQTRPTDKRFEVITNRVPIRR